MALPAAQCQSPPPPAAWFMEPRAPDLTRRMLNELSASQTRTTKDCSHWRLVRRICVKTLAEKGI
ncbi:lysis system o-spanin lipoprotein Rz1 [Pseudomonas chlororaphis]|nr:lysis system o-spanin lipoprotein Rz1 [Pseudomonas chlororaphis]